MSKVKYQLIHQVDEFKLSINKKVHKYLDEHKTFQSQWTGIDIAYVPSSCVNDDKRFIKDGLKTLILILSPEVNSYTIVNQDEIKEFALLPFVIEELLAWMDGTLQDAVFQSIQSDGLEIQMAPYDARIGTYDNIEYCSDDETHYDASKNTLFLEDGRECHIISVNNLEEKINVLQILINANRLNVVRKSLLQDIPPLVEDVKESAVTPKVYEPSPIPMTANQPSGATTNLPVETKLRSPKDASLTYIEFDGAELRIDLSVNVKSYLRLEKMFATPYGFAFTIIRQQESFTRIVLDTLNTTTLGMGHFDCRQKPYSEYVRQITTAIRNLDTRANEHFETKKVILPFKIVI